MFEQDPPLTTTEEAIASALYKKVKAKPIVQLTLAVDFPNGDESGDNLRRGTLKAQGTGSTMAEALQGLYDALYAADGLSLENDNDPPSTPQESE